MRSYLSRYLFYQSHVSKVILQEFLFEDLALLAMLSFHKDFVDLTDPTQVVFARSAVQPRE
jgi:hypothetical protein